MKMNTSSTSKSSYIQKSERYCVAALVLLTLAIFFLSVMTFSLNPLSPLGMLSVWIGVILMIGCIVSFALYNHYLKKEEESVPE